MEFEDTTNDLMEEIGGGLDFTDETVKTEVRRCLGRATLPGLYHNGPLNPANPIYVDDVVCRTTPGGMCALYDCMCYEDTDDWFTGYCAYCGEVVPDKESASRIMFHYGGFQGCYCSKRDYECLRMVYAENPSAIEHILIGVLSYQRHIIREYTRSLEYNPIDDEDSDKEEPL
jgi:hypothetical protein